MTTLEEAFKPRDTPEGKLRRTLIIFPITTLAGAILGGIAAQNMTQPMSSLSIGMSAVGFAGVIFCLYLNYIAAMKVLKLTKDRLTEEENDQP